MSGADNLQPKEKCQQFLWQYIIYITPSFTNYWTVYRSFHAQQLSVWFNAENKMATQYTSLSYNSISICSEFLGSLSAKHSDAVLNYTFLKADIAWLWTVYRNHRTFLIHSDNIALHCES